MTEEQFVIPYQKGGRDNELHIKIRDRLRDFKTMSQRKMADRYTKWEEAENLFMAYVPKSEADRVRDAQRKSSGTQSFTTVTLAYSYAMALTAHTYLTSVFLSRSPIHQFTGRHSLGEAGTQAVEAIMDYQVQVGGQLVPLYIWFMDVTKYGVGVVWNYWVKERVKAVQYVNEASTFAGFPLPGTSKKVRKIMEVDGYEGNKIFNVRPYDFYPDPRKAISDFQSGEFCGRQTWETLSSVRANPEYFNKEHLERAKAEWEKRERGSSQNNLPDTYPMEGFLARNSNTPGTVPLFEIVVNLIPEDWGLEGEGTGQLEKWIFTLAYEEVIIGARPQGCLHNQFPAQVMSYEIDGYSHQTRGLMEILKPLNDVLDWLFNTHFYNVRKNLNGDTVIDPSRVQMRDLLEGGPGRLIRLKPNAYGTDVRTIMQQMATMDVTSRHFNDAEYVAQMMQRIGGVPDNLMGMVNAGGRKTATEIRTSTGFGVNRQKTQAEWYSSMGFSRLAEMQLQSTQQYYDQEKQFRIVGELMMQSPKFINVTPENISGFYDYVPVDGTLPVDRFAQANLWKEILMGLAKIPQIGMSYDISGIFAWMAQLAGLKNITQFKLAPDQQLMNQIAQGQMVPAGGENGPGTNAGNPEGQQGAGASFQPGAVLQDVNRPQ